MLEFLGRRLARGLEDDKSKKSNSRSKTPFLASVEQLEKLGALPDVPGRIMVMRVAAYAVQLRRIRSGHLLWDFVNGKMVHLNQVPGTLKLHARGFASHFDVHQYTSKIYAIEDVTEEETKEDPSQGFQ